MLSVNEIKRFIDEDSTSEKKRFASVGEAYYEGRHDIYKTRFFAIDKDGNLYEDKIRANTRIAHTFFQELADQLTYYLLSSDENPIRAKDNVEGLQEHLDKYFNKAFWVEIGELVKDAYTKGFGYLYAYKNKLDRLVFECADSMGVVEVREKDTDDGCKYIIYWYVDRIEKGKKQIRRIQVWNDTETHYFVQSGANGKIVSDTSVEINPRPHVVYTDKKTGKKMGYPLGYIPFWRLDNNRKQISGVKPIKDLIDDYDLHACSLSNNLIDFDNPIYSVRGFQGDDLDELSLNLKTKKTIGVDSDGGVEVQTVDIPYQARKEKLQIDKESIYQFGFGLNTTGLRDTNATTNIAIKQAYSLLDIKANKMEDSLQALLESLLEAVLDEINKANEKDYSLSDIKFDFKRNIMANETENIQNEKVKAETKQLEINTILNVAAQIGDEQALKLICEQLDIDFDEVKVELDKLNEERNALAGAQNALNNVIPEEDMV